MFYSTIAKLQGQDKWPGTTATVLSNRVIVKGSRGSVAKITFTFMDSSKETQTAFLKVDDTTSLFNILVGDTFQIHYYLQNPRRVYSDEAENMGASFRMWFWLAVGIAIVVKLVDYLIKK